MNSTHLRLSRRLFTRVGNASYWPLQNGFITLSFFQTHLQGNNMLITLKCGRLWNIWTIDNSTLDSLFHNVNHDPYYLDSFSKGPPSLSGDWVSVLDVASFLYVCINQYLHLHGKRSSYLWAAILLVHFFLILFNYPPNSPIHSNTPSICCLLSLNTLLKIQSPCNIYDFTLFLLKVILLLSTLKTNLCGNFMFLQFSINVIIL